MEFVKKTYKPKEDKVKKLTTYITQLKIVKGVKCDLFTKAIIILVMSTGCSAGWHLKKAIKKDPSLAQTSTHTIDTLFVTDSVSITDTFTTKTIDTITIEKDGVKTIVYRNHDVIRVHTVVKADTIRYTKTIQLPAQIKYTERVKVPQWIGLTLFLGLILLMIIIKR
jgi:hypothetical protein